MADVQINDLTAKTTIASTDLYLLQDGTTGEYNKVAGAHILPNDSVTTAKIPSSAVTATKIDWSSLSLNIKTAASTSPATPTNGANNNLSSNGAAVTFTVASNCYAFVTVNVGVSSTSDFEHKPIIYLDGVATASAGYPATLGGGAAGRTIVRSYSARISLTTGAHTISAGVFISSATSPSVATGAANITAIVLGEVTA